VDKALTAIGSVAKLSDRKNYSYTDEQAERIIEALDAAIAAVKSDFSKTAYKVASKFEFKEINCLKPRHNRADLIHGQE
jgi:hypothetical protein